MDLEVKQDTVGRVYHGVPSIKHDPYRHSGAGRRRRHRRARAASFKRISCKPFARTPLLGNLPVIGRAFRRTEERDDKQELFIFITPQIVPEVAAASAASQGA